MLERDGTNGSWEKELTGCYGIDGPVTRYILYFNRLNCLMVRETPDVYDAFITMERL